MGGDDASAQKNEKEDKEEEKHLQTFLQEIRVLVPGAQVVGGVLFSIPFQQRFEKLSDAQHAVFVVTFTATILALVLFLAPAVYHRIASPIHEKRKFVALGTRFLIAGFVPLTVSTALSVYLVTSVAIGDGVAGAIAGAFAALILAAWWILPLVRLHDRVRSHGSARQSS